MSRPPPDADPLDRAPAWWTYVEFSVAVFSFAALLGLLAFCSCLLVVRHRQRLRSMCGVRAVLSVSVLLWVFGALASDVALWQTIDLIATWQPRTAERELICKVHTVGTYGLAEVLLLSLVGSIFYRKSQSPMGTPWHPWRLIRLPLALTLVATIAQAGLIALVDAGVASEAILGPQPSTPVNYTTGWSAEDADATIDDLDGTDLGSGADGAAPSLPPPLPPQPLVHSYPWWRAEGCASSFGSFGVSCVVIVVFELVWTLATTRLLATALNQRMRARLRHVQLTFTLTPPALLVLRALRLFLPADWYITRRLDRTAEVLLTILASSVVLGALICRPVREAHLAAAELRSGVAGGGTLVLHTPPGATKRPTTGVVGEVGVPGVPGAAGAPVTVKLDTHPAARRPHLKLPGLLRTRRPRPAQDVTVDLSSESSVVQCADVELEEAGGAAFASTAD